ncbi:MAG: DinB family protein [Chloroflexi bacterium]|nr:DinB family protein [Chloroflexota bacterium]MBV9598497.1 DinB family protein [Chloroflexota bacterium]
MAVEELVTRLERTVQQLLDEIERLPAEVLYRAPEPGEWPVMSTLAHLAELMPFWARAGAEIAASPGQHVGRALDDPRRVGPIEQHAQDSLDAMVPRVRAALAECVTIMRAIPPDGWQARGSHPRHPSISAYELIETYVCNHAAEHAKQIRATLQTLETARS